MRRPLHGLGTPCQATATPGRNVCMPLSRAASRRSDVLLDVRHMEPIISITWQYNLTGAAVRHGSTAGWVPQVSGADAPRPPRVQHARHGTRVVSYVRTRPDAAKYGTKDKSYRLVTLGADGKVMTWQWHKLEAPMFG